MSLDYIIHSFGAGEISEQLFFRGDFEKYELGAAQCRNWFIDYRGGASTRAGTRFIAPLQNDDLDIRFTKFQFLPDAANSYLLVFGHNYIRFIQNDGYVLEAAKTITAVTNANPGVVTAPAHGFSNGDYVQVFDVVGMPQLNGQCFWVKNVTTNTFTLHNSVGGNVSTAAYPAYVSGGTVSRVYTVATTFPSTALSGLNFNQVRNEFRISSAGFATRTLTRISHTNWALSIALSDTLPARPGTPQATASGAGTAGLIVCVTAVDALGQESLPSYTSLITGIVNYTVVAGSVTFTWPKAPGAVRYNVYRSVVLADGANMHTGYDLGYIGTTVVPELTDQNIIPDFVKTPPLLNKPFDNGVITFIDITNPGTGYGRTVASSYFNITTSTGSGFLGYPVANAAGEIIGVKIIDGGKNYAETDTIAIVSTGAGAGATATMTISPQTGNRPALSIIHQQRQIYAAPNNKPLTIFGSQVKRYQNFNVSEALNDEESFEFELDSEEATPIQHLLSVKGGLLVMTGSGVWLMNGGDLGSAITPKKALATPQSYIGVSGTLPLKIGEDIIYVEAVGSTVRLLGLNQYSDDYRGEDISILSNHFFSNSEYITNWAYAPEPFKIVWAVRSDGQMLGLTVVREHKVLAWTIHSTNGSFRDVLSMRENKTSGTYLMVERVINGRTVKYIEKFAPRTYQNVDEAWCVDAGLATDFNYPAGTLSFNKTTGTDAIATASSGIFSFQSVGAYLRCGAGRAIIRAYISATQVRVDIVADIPARPESTTAQIFTSGNWSYDTPKTVLNGLWHLEGETVSILADGNVIPPITVINGSITLPRPSTYVIVGLPYKCRLKTLPPSVAQGVIEDKLKRLVGLAFRHYETRGLLVGQREDELDQVKWDPPTIGDAPIPLGSEIKMLTLDGRHDLDGQLIFAQDDPLPATILGYTLAMDLGDVND